MNWKLIIFGTALIGSVVGVVMVFAAPKNINQVSIENQATELIDKATIEVSGQKLDFSNIAIGEKKTEKFKVGTDSHYEVSIIFYSGQKIEAQLGYVTSGASFKDTLVVTSDKVVLETGPITTK